MRQTPKWCRGTPIDCEFSVGHNYGDQVEIEDASQLEAWV
jgi:hypothetical protein